MTTLMPIHSAAMFHVDHVRSLMVVGARSRFQSGLAETSLRSSSKSRCVTAMSARLTDSVPIFIPVSHCTQSDWPSAPQRNSCGTSLKVKSFVFFQTLLSPYLSAVQPSLLLFRQAPSSAERSPEPNR